MKLTDHKRKLLELQDLQGYAIDVHTEALFGTHKVADTRDLSHARQVEAAIISFAEWCATMHDIHAGDEELIDIVLGKLIAHLAMASRPRPKLEDS